MSVQIFSTSRRRRRFRKSYVRAELDWSMLPKNLPRRVQERRLHAAAYAGA